MRRDAARGGTAPPLALLTVAIAAVLLVLGACTDGDDDGAEQATTTTAEAAETTVADGSEATGRGLLVNLATDDTWSANMALSLAQRAAEDGLDTIVFLNVRGVYLGHAGRMPATEGNSDQNVHEKLQAVIAAGGRVIACPSCSMEAGLTQEDYIEGVVVGEPGGILQFLGSPDFNVISYPQPTPAVG